MSAKPLNMAPLASASLVLVFSLWLGGCAATGSIPRQHVAGAEALACPLPTNCVNSLPGSGLAPLRFDGTAPEAIAALKATLAAFPEARIVKTGALTVEAVFTTPAGFQDRVDFLIDAPTAAHRLPLPLAASASTILARTARAWRRSHSVSSRSGRADSASSVRLQ